MATKERFCFVLDRCIILAIFVGFLLLGKTKRNLSGFCNDFVHYLPAAQSKLTAVGLGSVLNTAYALIVV